MTTYGVGTCKNPRRFVSKSGKEVIVGCRQCVTCISARVRDWAGRMLAETMYAVDSRFLTVTYDDKRRPEAERNRVGAADTIHPAVVLTYSHVQKFIRKLRDAGHRVRYFAVGEKGERKGRAHWHIILWALDGPLPKAKVDARGICIDDEWWPHGHVHYGGKVDGRSAHYLASYVVKGDQAKERALKGLPPDQAVARMSRFPLIGARHFEEMAKRAVEQGLPIRSSEYRVAGSYDQKSGKLWVYRMNAATARYLCEQWLYQWKLKNPDIDPPYSEFMERYIDARARPDRTALRQHISDGTQEFSEKGLARTVRKPATEPPSGYEYWWDDGIKAYVAAARKGGPILYWNQSSFGGHWSSRFYPIKPRVRVDAGEGRALPQPPPMSVASVPDHVPGEPMKVGKGRRSGVPRPRASDRDQDRYHAAMVEARFSRVSEAVRRLRKPDE